VIVVDVSDLPLDGKSGVIRGFESEQLNANFVMLDDGESMPRHRNDEVDVLIVVKSGAGTVEIDGELHDLSADTIALIPQGTVREVRAHRRLLYYTVHQRRAGLAIR